MPEVKHMTFEHREVVKCLLDKAGISDGIWMLYIEFGIAGANIGTSPEKKDICPTAVVPILKIGIQRSDEAHANTVDASAIGTKKAARKKT